MMNLTDYKTKNPCCKCKNDRTIKDFNVVFVFDNPNNKDLKQDKERMCIDCFKRYIRFKTRPDRVRGFELMGNSPVNLNIIQNIDESDKSCILCGSKTTYMVGEKFQWYRTHDKNRKYKENSFLCKACYNRVKRQEKKWENNL